MTTTRTMHDEEIIDRYSTWMFTRESALLTRRLQALKEPAVNGIPVVDLIDAEIWAHQRYKAMWFKLVTPPAQVEQSIWATIANKLREVYKNATRQRPAPHQWYLRDPVIHRCKSSYSFTAPIARAYNPNGDQELKIADWTTQGGTGGAGK